ncbi:response regulator [Anaeromyxobacter dehalogenans]|uniref:Response regulator receiver domain protein (CheY-like) n=1 Tax=Anaeromyxobacter dehalogenans (strain 2CP-C) TaxID=290397 RepID=Q2IE95_ANADE|nr:response regulator [Anaeromyxobacter dehalogenans]ABC82903.1 response regulator receiver domain protein (CheY-like) [Anaeromyxobacter dehalogenans 2CP-C]
MSESIVVSFGPLHGSGAREVMGALATLLTLVRDELEGCEAGFRRDSQGLLAVVRLGPAAAAAHVARLAFWCARAGGLALPLSHATASTRANVAEALRASDARLAIAPDRICEAVAALATAAGVEAPAEPPGPRPVLALALGGPGWEAMTYDPVKRRLFLPSPLSPPPGDRFELALKGDPGEGVAAAGTVRTVAVRDPFDPAAPSPAGFVVAVEEGRGLHALLAEACGAGGAAGGRGVARPRRPAQATVAHGRSGEEVAPGEPEVPRAELDAGAAGGTRARHRVLLVDDDALARALIADALAGRGFGVVAERDALAGLLRLAEEIGSLDVLVTDVVMPEVDGEELVRRVREVGGERDLPIVAVTASDDPALAARLRACGVDAVLAKRLGPEGIADAVVKVHRDARAVHGRGSPQSPAAERRGVRSRSTPVDARRPAA